MISINITTHPEHGDERGQIAASLAAIGFTPMGSTSISTGNVGSAEGGAPPKPASTRKTAAEKAAEKQGIQSGGERTDPTDSAADQEQDAKDEAAETAKNAAEAAAKKAAEPVKLTHDDVKNMMGGYVMHFGMEAAQEDGEALIGAPAISKIPDEQPAFAKAILAIMAGIEKNPKSRDIVGDGITPAKIATLKPIIAAAKAVAV